MTKDLSRASLGAWHLGWGEEEWACEDNPAWARRSLALGRQSWVAERLARRVLETKATGDGNGILFTTIRFSCVQ